MGTCSSSPVAPSATTMLILQDGELREFPRLVKVTHALEHEKQDPAWFVCDADGMELDGFVSAVPPDGELRPGRIYFVLPRHMLRRPLHATDLAALAVKASAALMRRESRSLVFGEAAAAAAPRAARPGRKGGAGGPNFEMRLNVILE